MGILLSIVIPVYNRQTGIENLLNSLVQSSAYQDYQENIEVIVIDDASTVAITLPSLPISHLVLSRHTENGGAPKSRARGFKLSHGEFVHFHDSDDAFSAQWLANVVELLTHRRDIDVLLTARYDIDKDNIPRYKVQKFFHKNSHNIDKIKKRLLYRNCMGPLGGVTFSRKVIESITFRNLASCQDWQMYLDVMCHAKVLVSKPTITYHFFVGGDDRISHNSLKKILGFLQLSKVTAKKSLFGKDIRFFYLYTCKMHLMKKDGLIKNFYKKHQVIVFVYFILITLYWRFF
ncbi:MAG TPA: glycosyltransferase family 2 protein [Thiothrix sp.]|nr:glycosyltransferase family 2 protein [Thiothrix sp.]